MILIKKAYLMSMAKINFEYKDILIDRGVIKKIDDEINEVDYKNCTVINALGRYVTPGLIESHCHIGLLEESYREGNDVNESSDPITPQMRGLDGINAFDPAFKKALDSGVTTICTGPGSANCIGGTFSILKNRGKCLEDMVVVPESAMKMALGENPKRVYAEKGPKTRMAEASLIRESLHKAKDYQLRYQKYLDDLQNGKDVDFNYDFKLDSLSRVFSGMMVKVHAHRVDDIETAVRLMEEFGLNYTIDHATEAYMIPDFLKKHNVKCILGPTMSSPSKVELVNKTYENAVILKDNGIDFSIMTDHPVIEEENLLLQIQKFVQAGLSELDAMKAITINAAKMIGMQNRIGSIEVGKDADLVIWSHRPIHYLARPRVVIIDGEIVKKR